MLNPFKLWKIYSSLNRIQAIAKEKMEMGKKILQIASILVGIAGATNAATMANGYVHQHIVLCSVLYALAQVLHAVLPSIFATPNASGAPSAAGRKASAILLAFGLSMGCVLTAHAQTTASSAVATTSTQSGSVAFTPASYAVYVSLAKTSVVGNLTTETLNVTKSCGIEGAQLIAPGINLQGFYGGVACTPDLSALLKKTLIPTNAFDFNFAADGGWAMNTTTGVDTKEASGSFRGCVSYHLGSGMVAPVCAGYLYAPGFGASPHGFIFSAGLGKVFGQL